MNNKMVASIAILIAAGAIIFGLSRFSSGNARLKDDVPERAVVCKACGASYPAPPGFMATISPEDYRMNPSGEYVFKCRECGKFAASVTIRGEPSE